MAGEDTVVFGQCLLRIGDDHVVGAPPPLPGIGDEHGRDARVLGAARTIAEAEMELARVRAVRAGLLKAVLKPGQNTINQGRFRALRVIDCYERRALSKRKFAIRTLAKLR
jgi:hypothetical protein